MQSCLQRDLRRALQIILWRVVLESERITEDLAVKLPFLQSLSGNGASLFCVCFFSFHGKISGLAIHSTSKSFFNLQN